jgi:hypothetical protein
MSPKQWDKLVEKHGKAKPHFQSGSPKSGRAHEKGKKHDKPAFDKINDTSHQIQTIPKHLSAQEKAQLQADKVDERRELAEKAGFDGKNNEPSENGYKNKGAVPKGADKNGAWLGKLKNPCVAKQPQMPTGRHH